MADEDIAEIEGQGKSKKGLIIGIVLAVNVVLIVGGFLVFSGGSSGEGDASGEQATEKRKKSAKTGTGPIVDLAGFVVNLSSEDGPRYLKVKVSVQLDTPEDLEPFNSSNAVVRNELLLQLSSVDLEAAKTVKGKRKLEKKLANAVNKRLDVELVSAVYFTEFVTQ